MRKTADSSESHIDCYEYENDDYSSVAKAQATANILTLRKTDLEWGL